MNQVPTTTLTQEQREQFDRDGYLVFDPEIPDEVLEGVKRDLDGKYAFEGDAWVDDLGVRYTPAKQPRITYAWKISEAAKQIVLAPNVLATLEQLYDKKPLPFQTLNFLYGSEQAPHQDGMYFNSDPLGYMCGVWVALEDVDMDNGPLVYYPGSHKLPPPSLKEIGAPDESEVESYDVLVEERVKHYQKYIGSFVERKALKPEYGTVRKGQALIWAAHLIHGGSPQVDRNRTRNSQVNHYYFEGDFRHFGPIRVQSDQLHCDYPARISWDSPLTVTPSVVKEAIEAHVPAGATVLVATRGNEELLRLDDRNARHFPQKDDQYVAYDQVRGTDAIDLLEGLRREGADYLAFPGTEAWSLQFPLGHLQQHLEDHYRAVSRDSGSCVIYALQ